MAAARSCAQPRVLRRRRQGVRVGGAWARRGDGGRGRVRRNYQPNLQRIKIIRANNLLRNLEEPRITPNHCKKSSYAVCVDMIKLTLDVSRSTDSSRAVLLGVAKTQVTALVLA